MTSKTAVSWISDVTMRRTDAALLRLAKALLELHGQWLDSAVIGTQPPVVNVRVRLPNEGAWERFRTMVRPLRCAAPAVRTAAGGFRLDDTGHDWR